MKSIVHIIENGPLLMKVKPLSLPQTVIWNGQCLTFITLEYLKSTIFAGLAKKKKAQAMCSCLPPTNPPTNRERRSPAGARRTSTLTCLWPAYEPNGLCLGISPDISRFFSFFPESVPAVLDLYCTRWPVGHRVKQPLFTDLRSRWGLQTWLWRGLSSIVSGFVRAARPGGRFRGVVGSRAWLIRPIDPLMKLRGAGIPLPLPMKVGASSI